MTIEIPGGAADSAAAVSDSWGHYLDSDETLLWQGAPSAGLRFARSDLVPAIIGIVLLGYLVFWSGMAASMSALAQIGQGMGMASGVGPGLVMVPIMFALPLVAIAGYLILGRPLVAAYRRRHTRYALTDRRAIVAHSAFGRSLRSYPIERDTLIDYRPGREATIWVAEEERRGAKGRRYTVKHGFEFIPDGDEVYRLMRQIQRRNADRHHG